MKIQVINDIHTEFGAYPDLPVAGDVLTVAGDLCTFDNIGTGIDWLNAQADIFDMVFFTPGNHEFYGGEWHNVMEFWRTDYLDLVEDNVVVLTAPGPGYIYNDVLFVGDTLWTDLKGGEPLTKFMFTQHMRDATACVNLTPDKLIDQNLLAKKAIEGVVRVHPHLPTVVVTHHLPCTNVIAPQWQGDHLNPAFANYDNWAERMLHWGNIKLWHFGHTHTPTDMILGAEGTRFVCNPVGYKGYETIDFDDCKVIEV